MLTLVANDDYKCRIVWLVSAGETPSDVAVIEYFSQHVEGALLGLCKDKAVNEPYAWTPAKNVYNKLTAELEVDAAPRSAAVVYDRKYREAMKDRQNNGTDHCKTLADKFQCIFNMVQSDRTLADPFVRYVVATGERVPSVML